MRYLYTAALALALVVGLPLATARTQAETRYILDHTLNSTDSSSCPDMGVVQIYDIGIQALIESTDKVFQLMVKANSRYEGPITISVTLIFAQPVGTDEPRSWPRQMDPCSSDATSELCPVSLGPLRTGTFDPDAFNNYTSIFDVVPPTYLTSPAVKVSLMVDFVDPNRHALIGCAVTNMTSQAQMDLMGSARLGTAGPSATQSSSTDKETETSMPESSASVTSSVPSSADASASTPSSTDLPSSSNHLAGSAVGSFHSLLATLLVMAVAYMLL